MTIKLNSASEKRESMSIEIPTGGLPNRRALKEFLGSHDYSITLNGATEARKAGKTLVFLFFDQEAYGDRSYYFCEPFPVWWTEPFPVWWTVKMEKKQNETEDILRYLT